MKSANGASALHRTTHHFEHIYVWFGIVVVLKNIIDWLCISFRCLFFLRNSLTLDLSSSLRTILHLLLVCHAKRKNKLVRKPISNANTFQMYLPNWLHFIQKFIQCIAEFCTRQMSYTHTLTVVQHWSFRHDSKIQKGKSLHESIIERDKTNN